MSAIEEKLDRVAESVASIDKTLAIQAIQLAEHMRRTDILEKTVAPIQTQITRWTAVLAAAMALPGAIEVVKWLLTK